MRHKLVAQFASWVAELVCPSGRVRSVTIPAVIMAANNGIDV